MSTPLNPPDREAWEKRLIHFEWYVKGGNSEDIKVLRDGIVRDILAIQSQLTEALAEVERLKEGLAKAVDVIVSARKDLEWPDSGTHHEAAYHTLNDFEKARQPK